MLPNGASITSTHVGKITMANSLLSTPVYIFPDDELQQSLISFSALCNEHNCVITLTRTNVLIHQGAKLLFHGTKAEQDTLWRIDLDEFTSCPTLSTAECHNAYKTDTNAEFVAFVHASFGSPTMSTFAHAVSMGWLSQYPRLAAAMVLANPPHAMATAKGHLNQTRQIKFKRQQRPYTVPRPLSVLPEPANATDTNDQDICIKLLDLADSSEPVHADLSGRFPVDSFKGNKYVLVACWHNYVHLEPMPSRKAVDYVTAYTNVVTFFRSQGRQPSIVRLDNETSTLLEAYLISEKISVQYVPPGIFILHYIFISSNVS
jgi:hypothetical protein